MIGMPFDLGVEDRGQMIHYYKSNYDEHSRRTILPSEGLNDERYIYEIIFRFLGSMHVEELCLSACAIVRKASSPGTTSYVWVCLLPVFELFSQRFQTRTHVFRLVVGAS